MRYVAAYLLAVLGGNNKPTDKDLMKILGSVGIDADGAAMTKVVKELSGKSIEQVIAAGREKLASVPSGGPVAAGGAAAPAADAGKAAVEEKKKEESEEEGSDDDMGFGLFD